MILTQVGQIWSNKSEKNKTSLYQHIFLILNQNTWGQIKNKCVLGNGSENFRKGRHTYIFLIIMFFLEKNKQFYAFWKAFRL